MDNLNILIEGNNDLSLLIKDPHNQILLQELVQFSSLLKRYGFTINPYSKTSLLALPSISNKKKDEVTQFFSNWSRWIEPENIDSEIIDIDIEKEKSFLKKALNHYGYWMHDDFWATLCKGQVIEIYGTDGVQLYRNLNFFNYCSYSLLDISIFDWPTLWERPSHIQEQMMKVAIKAFTQPIPVIEYQVPTHVLRETRPLDMSEHHGRIASLVHFKYAGSLFRSVDPKPVGGIATCEAEIIGVGKEAELIHFV